jgi:hypothetical protein
MALSAAQDARNRLGAAARRNPNDHVTLTAARRDLAAAYIKRTVDSAPPLTDEQRERIAALLRPSIGGPDAAA